MHFNQFRHFMLHFLFTMLKVGVEESPLSKSDLQNHFSFSFNCLSLDILMFCLDLQKRLWLIFWVFCSSSDLHVMSGIKQESAKIKVVFVRNLNKIKHRALFPNIGTSGACFTKFLQEIKRWRQHNSSIIILSCLFVLGCYFYWCYLH